MPFTYKPLVDNPNLPDDLKLLDGFVFDAAQASNLVPVSVTVQSILPLPRCDIGAQGKHDMHQAFASSTMSFTSRICFGYPLPAALIIARPTSCKVQNPAG